MMALAMGAVAIPGTSAWAQDAGDAATAQPMSTTVTTQDVQDDVNDPFEGSNRFFFEVNQVLDELLLRPVAVVYRAILPDFAQDGVRNFMNNLNSPVIFANDLFQGEGDRAGTTLLRFGINSTIGIGGLIDVAKELGVQVQLVSVPMNGWWYDHLGYTAEARAHYYAKIRELAAARSVRLADFSEREYQPAFLYDIMHLGWRGWLDVTRACYEFEKSA